VTAAASATHTLMCLWLSSSHGTRPLPVRRCDTELFNLARDATDAVGLSTSKDNAWAALWERAGGERPCATLRVAGAEQWDVLIHLFSSVKGAAAEEPAYVTACHCDGVLSLLKPLLGSVVISKRRLGAVFGSPRALDALSSRPLLQLGGPTQTYEPKSATAALLEVVLRHPIQQDRLPADLPSVGADLLATFFNATEARAKRLATPATSPAQPVRTQRNQETNN